MDRSLEKFISDFDACAKRLSFIPAHDALIILRSSLGAPKLTYVLRSSPCAGHVALDTFDKSLRNTLCRVLNIDLSDDQWAQASLPIRMGGLGVRSVSLLASSAFLASAAGTRDLQDRFLSQVTLPEDVEFMRIQGIWSSLSGLSSPTGSSSLRLQATWDDVICRNVFSSLINSVPDISHRARLLAVSSEHSSDWLHALPLSACGLRLDNETIRVCVGLRLGAKLCERHTCICGEQVDILGLHGLSCKKSTGRVSRHNFINDIVCRSLRRAGVPAIKEPSGLARSDGKRPDGITQIPWETGKCATWDVTVTDTLAASNLQHSAVVAGAAAEKAAERKIQKYTDLAACYSFIPIAFETLGPLNSAGVEFVRGIGMRTRDCTGDFRELSFLWQRLSVAIQRFNAVCILGTFEAFSDGLLDE